MSSSAINTQVAQLKIGNVQNQADNSAVYSGGIWSLKNSTALTSVTITDAGNVGIGTESPTSLNSATLAVVGSQGIAYQRSTNNQFAPTLDWFKSRGSFSAPTIVQNNDGLYTLRVVPFQGASFTTLNAHAIEIDGTFSSGQNPPIRHVWYTNTANGNSTERMRIDASGNLLVGYTSGGAAVTNGVVKAKAYNCKPGGSGALGANIFNINWVGSPQLWIDDVNVGTITVTSDYRIKKNIETQELPALERIAHLRPVKYEYTDYKELFKADGVQREGFIAHELQAVIPSAVDGEKDDEGQIQSLKLDALCSVMVKAIQELSTKNEALEARLAALEAK